MNKEEKLKYEVSDRILKVANLYNEVTTSDLQGISDATATKLINDLKRFWGVKE